MSHLFYFVMMFSIAILVAAWLPSSICTPASCLECPAGQKHDLLGAFSYRLTKKP